MVFKFRGVSSHLYVCPLDLFRPIASSAQFNIVVIFVFVFVVGFKDMNFDQAVFYRDKDRKRDR